MRWSFIYGLQATCSIMPEHNGLRAGEKLKLAKDDAIVMHLEMLPHESRFGDSFCKFEKFLHFGARGSIFAGEQAVYYSGSS